MVHNLLVFGAQTDYKQQEQDADLTEILEKISRDVDPIKRQQLLSSFNPPARAESDRARRARLQLFTASALVVTWLVFVVWYYKGDGLTSGWASAQVREWIPFVHHEGRPTNFASSVGGDSAGSTGATRQPDGGFIRATRAPRSSPWTELSEREIKDVLEVFEKRGKESGVPKDVQVSFVERLMANKTDVLPYLQADLTYDDETTNRIDGWARLVAVRPKSWGDDNYGGLSEWMVGPLPVSNSTTVQPLAYMYNSGRSYVRRPVPNIEQILVWFQGVITGPLRDIMSDLLGGIPDFTTMAKVPGLMALASPDVSTQENVLQAWLTVFMPSPDGLRDAFSLLSQGLYAHLEVHGIDTKDWVVTDWYYNGVLYNSTESFRDAWKTGALQKSKPNPDGAWTLAEPTEEGIEDREFAAPMLVQPYGPRVQVDVDQKYVKWMGWEFYVSFSQVTAMALHDIKFRGERIIYEIGMQEALAHYAGDSPSSAGQLFFDTLFGFGLNTYELVPGYDCPTYATFLPISVFREGTMFNRKNAICVFEAVSDHPLQRHTTGSKVTVSKNSYLVVRAVSTVGNYDYTVSYFFYLDGAVEVKVHASGYIFSDYLAVDTLRRDADITKHKEPFEYGYRIHDVVASLMHTHELSFRADLDIAGTANTVYRVAVEPFKRTYEWEPEVQRSTMRMVQEPITHESGLDWARNSQALYVVLNNDSSNAWGEKRGYKIVPGTGMGTPPHLATRNSTAAGRAATWAEHDIWVLRQHDYEPRGASEWNAWEIYDPLINFGRFLDDNESTVQEDLVLYFNLGVHHLSNSADVPNTLMHWSGTSVMLVPHNYHDRDLSRQAAQGVMMRLDEQGVQEVTYFGAKYDRDVALRKEDIEPDLTNFSPPRHGIGALAWNMTF